MDLFIVYELTIEFYNDAPELGLEYSGHWANKESVMKNELHREEHCSSLKNIHIINIVGACKIALE